ncbi:gamma carbonic anhydrase family protein [Mycoplasma sp. P36-A1]|uniref:gamma carbonic anhydrase family protein n=1 Tax=Mycoplasma sp. P36-A1 TaxID=3252900 RepID=UPI003C2D1F6C
MKCYSFKGKTPSIHKDAVVLDGVKIIGEVNIEAKANIWYNATIRGDLAPVTIKEGANVQELTAIHNDEPYPVEIGKYTTIGHGCIIHGAVIGDYCMIGMGSTLLNGVVIPKGCLVGAGSLVTKGHDFEEGMLIVGRPAKAIRPVSEADKKYIIENGSHYADLAQEYRTEVKLIED